MVLKGLPLFALTYALSGVIFGIWCFRRDGARVLRPLVGVILVLSLSNGYTEMWPFQKNHENWASLLPLCVIFLVLYSLLCVRLMQEAGIGANSWKSAVFATRLPWLYMLAIGMLQSPRSTNFENPPFAVYVFILLCCALHAPMFAAGKIQAIKLRRMNFAHNPSGTDLIHPAMVALGAPLLLILVFQIGKPDDWRLFGVNLVMSVTILSLFYIALVWKTAVFDGKPQ
jgi:hypothetical protein